jgi:FkbM family methyltransferase
MRKYLFGKDVQPIKDWFAGTFVPLMKYIYPKEPYLVKTKYGFKMYVRPEFNVGLSGNVWLTVRGHIEPFVTELFLKHINKNSVCVDVGAYVGWFTLLFAKYGKHVYAFEPRKDTASILQRNVKINNFKNVEVIRRALSDKKGVFDFYIDENSGADSLFNENPRQMTAKVDRVKVTTLDSFFKKGTKIDIMKIDAENAEALILKGAERLLKENPNMIMTVEANDIEHLNKIKEVMKGYKFTKLDGHNYLIKK